MNPPSTSHRFIRELVGKRAAIELDESKDYLVDARLSSLVREEGLANLETLVGLLMDDPGGRLEGEVIEALTTNETLWFRDLHPFELLKSALLPEIIEGKSASRVLNIWCGAASTGQEPYSLCILLREKFPQLANWSINFIATDLSQQVLERARAGLYSQIEINRGLPANLLAKYFRPRGERWEIVPELRDMVNFQQMNLIGKWKPMQPLDLVMIRNVLIYFCRDVKQRILRQARERMRPGGVMLLGSTESTLGLDTGFQTETIGRTTVHRVP